MAIETRVAQEGIEILDTQTAETRIAQEGIELVDKVSAEARIAQEGIEINNHVSAETRIAQFGIEIFRRLPNPAAGIYQLVPGKTNDTLFLTFSPITTHDVKIPDPFIETAVIRDK